MLDIIKLDILMKTVEGTHVDRALACYRLSDGGEDAEDWVTRETEKYAKGGIFMFALSQSPWTRLSLSLEANRALPV